MKRISRTSIIFLIIAISLIIVFFAYLPQLRHTIETGKELMITLPQPVFESKTSVEYALKNRRSAREYQNKPLTLQAVGQLLWAAQGVTSNNGYRTSPSAGALYPLSVYVVCGNVDGLPAGLYRYIPEKHSLIKLDDEDVRERLSDASLKQHDISMAPIDIVITANYKITTHKYGDRGIRFVHMEAGHAAQNIYLQAVSLTIGTVSIGAFDDRAVREILRLGNDEQPLYIMPAGKI